jgi:hypothetical protein
MNFAKHLFRQLDLRSRKAFPWNPFTGWPTGWTTGSPDAVMHAMGPMMIKDIEQSARSMNLKKFLATACCCRRV